MGHIWQVTGCPEELCTEELQKGRWHSRNNKISEQSSYEVRHQAHAWLSNRRIIIIVKIKMKMWDMRVKRYMDWEEILIDNTNKFYGIGIGQCTPPLILTTKGDAEYNKIILFWHSVATPKNKENKRKCGHEVKFSFDFAWTNDHLTDYKARSDRIIWWIFE